MKNRLPCELIRDLLPSYIENLTSDVTNNLIEEHLDTCEECKRVHDSMREPLEKSEDIEELQEIDFLKTARKKTRKIIFGISLAVVVIVTALVIAKEYFVGTQISSEYVACYVDVKENTLELSGRIVDEKLDISKVQFQEDDGVVTISFQSVHNSPFYDNEFEEKYIASDKITEVKMDDRIIWYQGKYISTITSSVYSTRHPYVGDMSENGRTVTALDMVGKFGNFTNDLQTNEEPYGWKLIFEDPVPEEQRAEAKEKLKAYAYVMIAVIDNLDWVSYEYTTEGETCELIVTSEDAAEFAGQDIKNVGKDVAALQELMEKVGLAK